MFYNLAYTLTPYHYLEGNRSKLHEVTKLYKDSFSSRVNVARVTVLHEIKKKQNK